MSHFFDFGLWTVEDSDKVENNRFLENCWIDVAENQRKELVSYLLSPSIIKNFQIGSESLPIFFDFKCADGSFQNIFLAESVSTQVITPK